MEHPTKSEQLKSEVLDFALENGILEVIFREGDAPVKHNPNPVKISGTITAPALFVAGRKDDFSESKRHCLVSKTDGKIELIINEQSTTDKYTVIGQIEISKKFKNLGINTDTSYQPKELANKLKLLRNLFPKPLEHAQICATLRNLVPITYWEIEDNDDKRGNVKQTFVQTVESNVPDSITLRIPLLEGEDPVDIEVAVTLEASGTSQIECFLESIEAAEIIEEQFEKRVSEEVEKIKEFTTIIYY